MPKLRIIGLTGGIATGKTTVAEYLASAYALPILDADIYAREAVQPGSPILVNIVDRFGSEILLPDARLNRSQLGEIIFSDPTERRWLESQIHPYVRDRLQAEQQALAQHPILVMVVPLLFEAKMTDLVTEIWVVSCSQTTQRSRLSQRDRLTLAQAQARIDSQMPLTQKVAQAEVVLDNSATLESLLQQVDAALGFR